MANSLLKRSESLLAAAAYLSIDCVTEAVNILSYSGEFDLAYSIASVFDKDVDYHLTCMAHIVADTGNLHQALKIISSSSSSAGGPVMNHLEISAKFLCRYCNDDEDARVYISKYNLKSPSYWAQKGYEEESIGQDAKVVLYYSLGWQFTKAGIYFDNTLTYFKYFIPYYYYYYYYYC